MFQSHVRFPEVYICDCGRISKNGQKVKPIRLVLKAKGSYWDEFPRAKQVAEKWEPIITNLFLDPEDLLNDLVQMVWHLDEPYSGGLPSWKIFEFMAHDVKVGLTGTGGDEMFDTKWRGLSGWFHKFLFKMTGRVSGKISAEIFERYYYFGDRGEAFF